MTSLLDVAKVTSKGQITIPAGIRRAVGVREGNKVLFVREVVPANDPTGHLRWRICSCA